MAFVLVGVASLTVGIGLHVSLRNIIVPNNVVIEEEPQKMTGAAVYEASVINDTAAQRANNTMEIMLSRESAKLLVAAFPYDDFDTREAAEPAFAETTAQPMEMPLLTPAPFGPRSLNVDSLISVARQQLGKRYRWGAKGPNIFDCSGFVYYCLNQSGYSIGYMTSAGWRGAGYTSIRYMSDLQPGDICIFKEHVGIYIGGGNMIHCSSAAGCVLISSLDTAFRHNNWVAGRRLT